MSSQADTLLAPARSLFASTTLASFIEERHKTLLAVDETTSVGEAIKLLAENKILSAPVLAADRASYSGCISLADILKGLVKQVEARRILHGTNWEEKVASIKEADLIEIGKELFARPVSHFCHAGSLLLEAEEGVNLAEVLETGFSIHEHPHHRIYVCHEHLKPHQAANGTAAHTHTAKSWKPSDVVSQTDLLAFLHAAKASFPELANSKLESLGLTATGVTTASTKTSALDAFHMMFVDRHSAVGLVDIEDGGKLVGNLSVTDLRGLADVEAFSRLALPVLEFVKPTARPLISLPPTATFGELLDTLVAQRLRRVYVISQEDGKEQIDGIVSITDVLRLVANPPINEEGGGKDEDDEEMEDGNDEDENADEA